MVAIVEKPVVKMMGDIGDSAYFVGKVVAKLRLCGMNKEAEEFVLKSESAIDCDSLTKVILEYVDVE